MEMYKDHPRYRKIVLINGNGNYHNQDKRSIKLVFYISDKKLRCHTVKHFMNPKEFKKNWKNYTPIDQDVVRKSIDNLKHIGCERNINWVRTPPCNKCPSLKFSKCTDYVSDIEEHYLKASLKNIISGGAIPRFADFYSNWFKADMFVLMSDRPIIIKAVYLEDGTYNLMTCYSHVIKDSIEMRRDIREKVLIEARKDSICWCKKNKWGFKPYIQEGKFKQFLDKSNS